jgi:hypothetical protein
MMRPMFDAGLLRPKRVYGIIELCNDPTLVPQENGLYTWWFSKNVPPVVPVDHTAVHQGRRLLYVGIAPKDNLSRSTLQSRLKLHCRGPLAKSTLRRTLSALLRAELDLSFTLTNPGQAAKRSTGRSIPSNRRR